MGVVGLGVCGITLTACKWGGDILVCGLKYPQNVLFQTRWHPVT